MVRIPLLAGCLAWSVLSVASVSPREISYQNELARTLDDGIPKLADSNLDWGQGLPALKTWMDSAGVNQVYLAYFGTDRPEAYGIRYQQLPSYGHVWPTASESIALSAPRHVVAISANHLFGLFLNDPSIYAWLRSRQPATKLDGSIYVFDLTDDPEAIARIREFIAQ